MPRSAFQRVDAWIFDLDNTLYHPSARLFDQIEARMTEFVATALGVARDEADRLRAHYWRTYGTTLAGLMREHGVDPGPYLDAVHDITLDHLPTDPTLRDRISALPGKRVVFTNGPRAHAERVADARGLAGVFDAIFGIEDAHFIPKPERAAFDRVLGMANIAPARAAMFEDDPRNLAVPHAMGMVTVQVHTPRDPAPHVHHHAKDLSVFLSHLVA